MMIEDFLARLEGVRPRGAVRWSARCPAHADRSPSLSVCEGARGILLRCFAGCAVTGICAALDLRVADLFSDAPLPKGQRPAPRPAKIDRVAIAFRFDLAALDLRLRAGTVAETAKGIDISSLSEVELDRALNWAAQAHLDEERAQLFEHVADTLRMREFTERDHARQERVA